MNLAFILAVMPCCSSCYRSSSSQTHRIWLLMPSSSKMDSSLPKPSPQNLLLLLLSRIHLFPIRWHVQYILKRDYSQHQLWLELNLLLYKSGTATFYRCLNGLLGSRCFCLRCSFILSRRAVAKLHCGYSHCTFAPCTVFLWRTRS